MSAVAPGRFHAQVRRSCRGLYHTDRHRKRRMHHETPLIEAWRPLTAIQARRNVTPRPIPAGAASLRARPLWGVDGTPGLRLP